LFRYKLRGLLFDFQLNNIYVEFNQSELLVS